MFWGNQFQQKLSILNQSGFTVYSDYISLGIKKHLNLNHPTNDVACPFYRASIQNRFSGFPIAWKTTKDLQYDVSVTL